MARIFIDCEVSDNGKKIEGESKVEMQGSTFVIMTTLADIVLGIAEHCKGGKEMAMSIFTTELLKLDE